MTRQNRVSPLGEICAVPCRGLFMGNRGILHDRAGNIRRHYAVKRWICCLTSFKERKRPLMQPGRYTELFFLDEAVALAAGHRPCAECRREAFTSFVEHYQVANPEAANGARLSASVLDTHLHARRISDEKHQRRYVACLRTLPDGAMFLPPALSPQPSILWHGKVLAWTWSGYRPAEPLSMDQDVTLLTPRPIVAALADGYVPAIHPTAEQGVTA